MEYRELLAQLAEFFNTWDATFPLARSNACKSSCTNRQLTTSLTDRFCVRMKWSLIRNCVIR